MGPGRRQVGELPPVTLLHLDRGRGRRKRRRLIGLIRRMMRMRLMRRMGKMRLMRLMMVMMIMKIKKIILIMMIIPSLFQTSAHSTTSSTLHQRLKASHGL